MTFTNAGLALIKKYEGFSPKAYFCPAHVLTIGFGHTGPDVVMGDQISELEAENLLRGDLQCFEHGVSELVAKDTTDNQFTAMVCLAFNIGLGNFKKSSVLRFHNEGQKKLAQAAFMLWVKAKGRTLNGLVKRRAAESNLYAS